MSIKFFFEEEEHKGVLIILGFILGILTYFSIPFEPSFYVCLFLTLLSFLFVFLRFFKRKGHFATLFFFFLCLGFFVPKVHVCLNDTTFLKEPLEKVILSGTVLEISNKATSAEVILTNVRIENKKVAHVPQKIKMWFQLKSVNNPQKPDENLCLNQNELSEISNKRGPEKQTGRKRISTDTCVFEKPMPLKVEKNDVIRGYAFYLNPPGVPTMTSGFFEARSYYFDKLEAKGIFSDVTILKKGGKEFSFVEDVREKIKQRISFLDSDTKGVVNALILGDRTLLESSTELLYRILGLTHVLSVSGFHVGLIAFLVFYVVRFLLTFLFINTSFSGVRIRQLSALISLFVTFMYVCVSGGEPPAVRAFIMLSFLFVCFFVNRKVLSIRSVFVAAFLLLIYKPILILNVGFQLSFVAVLCLCALVKEVNDKIRFYLREHRFLLGVLVLLVLNILVCLSTMPFIMYHFHKIAVYGIIGNLLLSFIFSLFVMPLLVVAVLAMPFGFDKIFFSLSDQVLKYVHSFGENIALLPYTEMPVAMFSAWGLLCFSIGFILFSVLSGKLRFVGLFIICLFPLSFFSYPKNDIMIAKEGRLIALRNADNQFVLNESFRHRFISSNWLLLNGQQPIVYQRQKDFVYDAYIKNGKKIAFSSKDCDGSDITFEVLKDDYSLCPNRYTKEKITKASTIEVQIIDDEIKINELSKIDEGRPWSVKTQNN